MKTLLVAALFAWCGPQDAQDAQDPLPPPTGPAAVGRVTFHWRDDAREELETSAADDQRELLVHLFFPAEAAGEGERAKYQPDADVMRGAWRDEELERVLAMTTHCRDGGGMVAGDTKHSVLVFSPGGALRALHYHALLEDLASHGYVVAAIDPPYNARRMRMPDGRVLGDQSPAQRGWPQPKSRDEEQRFYRERVNHWARDVVFTIDRLEALDRDDGPFKGRLDLARGVGVFGHSRGGQVAAVARVLDPRVRSGINIDGAAGEAGFTTEESEEGVGVQPFLWLQKAMPKPPSDEQLQRAGRTRAEFDAKFESVMAGVQRRLQAVKGGALWVNIERPGVDHIDFADESMWDPTLSSDVRTGKLATIADARTWIRAFFDGTVRGEWEPLKKLAAEDAAPRADVVVRRFGTMWP